MSLPVGKAEVGLPERARGWLKTSLVQVWCSGFDIDTWVLGKCSPIIQGMISYGEADNQRRANLEYLTQ